MYKRGGGQMYKKVSKGGGVPPPPPLNPPLHTHTHRRSSTECIDQYTLVQFSTVVVVVV